MGSFSCSQNKKSEVKTTVLLAEDESFIRGIIKTIMDRENYDVIAVPNGRIAVDCYKQKSVEQKPIDIVVLDSIMPVLDGYDAYLELKKYDSDLKAVFLTNHVKYDLVKLLYETGHPVILKPFKVDYLCSVLDLVLKKP